MAQLAMVTGASSGLGREYAIQLSEKGYDLILVSRSLDRLGSVKRSLHKKFSNRIDIVQADLTIEADLNQLLQLVRGSDLDLLVNAAGFGTIGLFAQNDIEKSMNLVRLQVDAVTRLCYACLPNMLENNHGDIINVGSTIAFMTQRYNVIYAATKYYLMGFGASLYRELMGKNVFVQTLLPGLTRTDFYDTPELAPAKLSTKIPEKFWMKPCAVVASSIKALNYHKKFVVPGWRNKLFILLYQCSDYWQMLIRGSRKKTLRFEK